MQIKNFRKKWGLSQTDTADLLGVTQATISNWERYTHEQPEWVRRFIKILERHPEEIKK